MNKNVNPVVIGLFTLGAVALALGAVLVFGSGRFFEQRDRFVIFFDQSVRGLNIGSPVIFRGVVVGNVVDIHAMLVQEDPPLIEIPVYVELIRGVVEMPTADPYIHDLPGIQRLVDAGMRAELGLQSLVTGQLNVSLAFHPEVPIDLTGYDPDTPELPSRASDLELLRETVFMVARQFRELPLKDLSDNLVSLIGGLDDMVTAPGARESLSRAEETLTAARDLLARLDTQVDALSAELTSTTQRVRSSLDVADRTLGNADTTFGAVEQTLGKADTTLATVDRALGSFEQTLGSADEALDTAVTTLETATTALATADQTLRDVDQMLVPGSPVQYELQSTLEEVQRVARQLGTLLDELSRQPDAILFGRGERGDDK